jgi:hypothetical protein
MDNAAKALNEIGDLAWEIHRLAAQIPSDEEAEEAELDRIEKEIAALMFDREATDGSDNTILDGALLGDDWTQEALEHPAQDLQQAAEDLQQAATMMRAAKALLEPHPEFIEAVLRSEDYNELCHAEAQAAETRRVTMSNRNDERHNNLRAILESWEW